MPVFIPEDESQILINCMDTYPSFNASLDEKQQFDCKNLESSDIRSLMHTESAKQDKYLDILCNLLDESVMYNDSNKVG